jgi:hypothetical protein
MPLKMFCVKEFADGTNAGRCSAFAADVIGAINTAAINAVKRPAGNKGEQRTSVTEKLSKQSLIKETDKGLIVSGDLYFSLWIKVPLQHPLLAASLRRHHSRRLPLKQAANNQTKP